MIPFLCQGSVDIAASLAVERIPIEYYDRKLYFKCAVLDDVQIHERRYPNRQQQNYFKTG